MGARHRAGPGPGGRVKVMEKWRGGGGGASEMCSHRNVQSGSRMEIRGEMEGREGQVESEHIKQKGFKGGSGG